MLLRGPHEMGKPSERASATHKDPHTIKKTEAPTTTAERAVRRGTCVWLHTPHSVWGGPRVYGPPSARRWPLSDRQGVRRTKR